MRPMWRSAFALATILALTLPALPMAAATNTVASSTITTSGGKSAGAATVELWRYPYAGGTPTLVDSQITSNKGQATLSDSMAGVNVIGDYINYEEDAFYMNSANTAVTSIGDYSFAVQYVSGTVKATNTKITLQSVTTTGGPATAVTPYDSGHTCQGYWQKLYGSGDPGWTSVFTTIGEEHASTGVTTTFKYQQNAGTQTESMTMFSGGAFSTSGSTISQNELGWFVDYGGYQASGSGIQTQGQFDYEEDAWRNTCTSGNWYVKVYMVANSYKGGRGFGSLIQGDNDCPSTVTATGDGNWAQYNMANWVSGTPFPSATENIANGNAYSNGVTLGGVVDVYGLSLGFGLTMTTTNYYNKYEATQFLFDATFTPNYYLYSGKANWTGASDNWPTVHVTSDYYSCTVSGGGGGKKKP